MRPVLLTPALLEVRAFVVQHGPVTSADLVAAGWCRSGATAKLHALWRSGVLVRGLSALRKGDRDKAPYAYVASAREVRLEAAPVPLHEAAAGLLRERGPLTSRELADALDTTPKTIATIARRKGWNAVRDDAPGWPPVRLRWSA